MEFDKNICPVVNVDGMISAGKQFDLDITLPKDNRNVIYGVIKNCHKEPVRDAVVKLIEVCKTNYGKEEKKPVSHTFTDKDGEFVFGPLCPDKYYEIQIWVDEVKHTKICVTCEHHGSCLNGTDIDCHKTHKPYKECDDSEPFSCEDHCKDHDDKKKCEKPCKDITIEENEKYEDGKDSNFKAYPLKGFNCRR